MPTYDYQCRACGSMTEVIHSMLEDGPSACAACGGELRRVLYPTGIIFKGSGFYRTDSRPGSPDGASESAPANKTDEAATKPTEKASSPEGGKASEASAS